MSTKQVHPTFIKFRRRINFSLVFVLLAGVGPLAIAAFSLASSQAVDGWYTVFSIALILGGGAAFLLGRKVLSDLLNLVERSTLAEARLRRLMQFSGDWYWQQDEHRVITRVLYRGKEVDDGVQDGPDATENRIPFVGKARRDVPDLKLLNENLNWDSFDRLMMEGSNFTQLRFEYWPQTSPRLIFESSGRPVKNSSQQVVGYEGVSVDITQKALNERLLAVQRFFLQGILLSAPLDELLQSYARGLKTCLTARCELVIGYRYRGGKGKWRLVGGSSGFRVPANLGQEIWNSPQEALEPIDGIENNNFIQVGKVKTSSLSGDWSNTKAVRSAWLAMRKADENGQGSESDYWVMVVQNELEKISEEDVLRVLMAIRLVGLCVERRLFEDELLTLNSTLEDRIEARTAQLTQTNTELEAFTYTVSHDLRAPLRAIDGFSTILREDFEETLPADAVGLLNRISSNARQMGGLIDGLLDFSRLLRTEITRVPVNLNEMLENVLEQLDARKKAKIELVDLPKVSADPILIQQVWMNLIDNALKFSAKNEAPKVTISCQPIDNGWRFSVADNGAGFDMKFYDKLFKVFERLHHQKDFNGTGVGLAIVKRIVERHGGEISATSELGHGACFAFSIANLPEPTAEKVA